MTKKTISFRASEDFYKKMKELRLKFLLQGKEVSLTDVADKIVKTPDFQKLESQLTDAMNLQINFSFDKRRK